MAALTTKLETALESRKNRQIFRQLPSPTDDPSSGQSTPPVDFSSNDYLSLSTDQRLRDLFLEKLNAAPKVLGSGGSRLLVNGVAYQSLEERLASFFSAPSALLFNSGFDANVSFFACIPQDGDAVLYDEHIHASVHDGIRASRSFRGGSGEQLHVHSFCHNSLEALDVLINNLLWAMSGLSEGNRSVFVAVESLYSMDGTFAPLKEMTDLLEIRFPLGNAYLVVDEAHATGIYGPSGRGIVSMQGLESKIFARLHTFGKALAGTGAVLLTSPLVKSYLINYARPFIFTTGLGHSNIVLTECCFDILAQGVGSELSSRLRDLIKYCLRAMKTRLSHFLKETVHVPKYAFVALENADKETAPQLNTRHLLSPIIPLMTTNPRPLAAYLWGRGYNARPITWPTVPKGKERIRVCLHAGNTEADIDGLVNGIVEWSTGVESSGKQDETSKPITAEMAVARL